MYEEIKYYNILLVLIKKNDLIVLITKYYLNYNI